MTTLAAITADLQGCDPEAMSADAVAAVLRRLVVPVADSVTLPLLQSLGRVLAEDIVSPIDVPPHDNSAMDGYAFDGRQLQAGAALVLEVVGVALAGKPWRGPIAPGQCVKIMTGAVVPDGLDTVVPHERVTRPDEDRVLVPAGCVNPGDNRRPRGEDLQKGQPALRRGERLDPARLGLAASLGLQTVSTWRPLRVAVFSTGDELLSPGEAARDGAVYDSNRYTLFGLLTRLGCEVIDLGVVKDEPTQLQAAFTEAAARADVVITSGGVSSGDADFTRPLMQALGDVAFWNVAMRPGRPLAVGRLHGPGPQPGPLLFGLPGNPVAVMVTFLAFVRPALLQMMGATAAAAPTLRARSAQDIRKRPGRTEYQRGQVFTSHDGTLQVRTTGHQGSGVLRSMAEANGLIVLTHSQGDVAQGEEVEVMMFEGAM